MSVHFIPLQIGSVEAVPAINGLSATVQWHPFRSLITSLELAVATLVLWVASIPHRMRFATPMAVRSVELGNYRALDLNSTILDVAPENNQDAPIIHDLHHSVLSFASYGENRSG
jgi:hypothetical protein